MKLGTFLLLASTIVNASTILLDSTGGAAPSSVALTAGSVGQGILVNTSTTLTQFGIWVGSNNGGSADFQIWDSTLSNVLFSDVLSVTPGSFSLVLTDPFSLPLQAGGTYYFDVQGPGGGALNPANAQQLGYTLSPVSSADGLSLVFPNSRVDGSMAVISPQDDLPIAIELIGDQGVAGPAGTATPEPSTFALLGVGSVLLVVRLFFAP